MTRQFQPTNDTCFHHRPATLQACISSIDLYQANFLLTQRRHGSHTLYKLTVSPSIFRAPITAQAPYPNFAMTAMRATLAANIPFIGSLVAQRSPLLSDARMQAHVAARRYRPIAAERGLSPPRCNTFQVQLHDSKSTDTGLRAIGSEHVPTCPNDL